MWWKENRIVNKYVVFGIDGAHWMSPLNWKTTVALIIVWISVHLLRITSLTLVYPKSILNLEKVEHILYSNYWNEKERESYVILVFQILFTFSQSHEHWTVFLRFTCRQTTIIGLTREAKKNNNVPSKNKPTHRQTDDTHIHAELIWLANILLFDLTWQKYCDSSQIIYIHTYKNPQINCRYLWLRI